MPPKTIKRQPVAATVQSASRNKEKEDAQKDVLPNTEERNQNIT
jgi:hypothetical protein